MLFVLHSCPFIMFQYIRVMADGAQCAEEGPFFATTPRAIIQNGMLIDQGISITPDWFLIGLMLACFFILLLILVLALVRFEADSKFTFMFLLILYLIRIHVAVNILENIRYATLKLFDP